MWLESLNFKFPFHRILKDFEYTPKKLLLNLKKLRYCIKFRIWDLLRIWGLTYDIKLNSCRKWCWNIVVGNFTNQQAIQMHSSNLSQEYFVNNFTIKSRRKVSENVIYYVRYFKYLWRFFCKKQCFNVCRWQHSLMLSMHTWIV